MEEGHDGREQRIDRLGRRQLICGNEKMVEISNSFGGDAVGAKPQHKKSPVAQTSSRIPPVENLQ